MQKIEQDITVVIEEFGAIAEVLIPAFEMNDLRREQDEYLAQTASDLYDRVVYMVRTNRLQYDPELDDDQEGPLVKLTLSMGFISLSSAFWMDTRRERQNKLMHSIKELFRMLLNMKKNFDDVVREEKDAE